MNILYDNVYCFDGGAYMLIRTQIEKQQQQQQQQKTAWTGTYSIMETVRGDLVC